MPSFSLSFLSGQCKYCEHSYLEYVVRRLYYIVLESFLSDSNLIGGSL